MIIFKYMILGILSLFYLSNVTGLVFDHKLTSFAGASLKRATSEGSNSIFTNSNFVSVKYNRLERDFYLNFPSSIGKLTIEPIRTGLYAKNCVWELTYHTVKVIPPITSYYNSGQCHARFYYTAQALDSDNKVTLTLKKSSNDVLDSFRLPTSQSAVKLDVQPSTDTINDISAKKPIHLVFSFLNVPLIEGLIVGLNPSAGFSVNTFSKITPLTNCIDEVTKKTILEPYNLDSTVSYFKVVSYFPSVLSCTMRVLFTSPNTLNYLVMTVDSVNPDPVATSEKNLVYYFHQLSSPITVFAGDVYIAPDYSKIRIIDFPYYRNHFPSGTPLPLFLRLNVPIYEFSPIHVMIDDNTVIDSTSTFCYATEMTHSLINSTTPHFTPENNKNNLMVTHVGEFAVFSVSRRSPHKLVFTPTTTIKLNPSLPYIIECKFNVTIASTHRRTHPGRIHYPLLDSMSAALPLEAYNPKFIVSLSPTTPPITDQTTTIRLDFVVPSLTSANWTVTIQDALVDRDAQNNEVKTSIVFDTHCVHPETNTTIATFHTLFSDSFSIILASPDVSGIDSYTSHFCEVRVKTTGYKRLSYGVGVDIQNQAQFPVLMRWGNIEVKHTLAHLVAGNVMFAYQLGLSYPPPNPIVIRGITFFGSAAINNAITMVSTSIDYNAADCKLKLGSIATEDDVFMVQATVMWDVDNCPGYEHMILSVQSTGIVGNKIVFEDTENGHEYYIVNYLDKGMVDQTDALFQMYIFSYKYAMVNLDPEYDPIDVSNSTDPVIPDDGDNDGEDDGHSDEDIERDPETGEPIYSHSPKNPNNDFTILSDSDSPRSTLPSTTKYYRVMTVQNGEEVVNSDDPREVYYHDRETADSEDFVFSDEDPVYSENYSHSSASFASTSISSDPIKDVPIGSKKSRVQINIANIFGFLQGYVNISGTIDQTLPLTSGLYCNLYSNKIVFSADRVAEGIQWKIYLSEPAVEAKVTIDELKGKVTTNIDKLAMEPLECFMDISEAWFTYRYTDEKLVTYSSKVHPSFTDIISRVPPSIQAKGTVFIPMFSNGYINGYLSSIKRPTVISPFIEFSSINNPNVTDVLNPMILHLTLNNYIRANRNRLQIDLNLPLYDRIIILTRDCSVDPGVTDPNSPIFGPCEPIPLLLCETDKNGFLLLCSEYRSNIPDEDEDEEESGGDGEGEEGTDPDPKPNTYDASVFFDHIGPAYSVSTEVRWRSPKTHRYETDFFFEDYTSSFTLTASFSFRASFGPTISFSPVVPTLLTYVEPGEVRVTPHQLYGAEKIWDSSINSDKAYVAGLKKLVTLSFALDPDPKHLPETIGFDAGENSWFDPVCLTITPDGNNRINIFNPEVTNLYFNERIKLNRPVSRFVLIKKIEDLLVDNILECQMNITIIQSHIDFKRIELVLFSNKNLLGNAILDLPKDGYYDRTQASVDAQYLVNSWPSAYANFTFVYRKEDPVEYIYLYNLASVSSSDHHKVYCDTLPSSNIFRFDSYTIPNVAYKYLMINLRGQNYNLPDLSTIMCSVTFIKPVHFTASPYSNTDFTYSVNAIPHHVNTVLYFGRANNLNIDWTPYAAFSEMDYSVSLPRVAIPFINSLFSIKIPWVTAIQPPNDSKQDMKLSFLIAGEVILFPNTTYMECAAPYDHLSMKITQYNSTHQQFKQEFPIQYSHTLDSADPVAIDCKFVFTPAPSMDNYNNFIVSRIRLAKDDIPPVDEEGSWIPGEVWYEDPNYYILPMATIDGPLVALVWLQPTAYIDEKTPVQFTFNRLVCVNSALDYSLILHLCPTRLDQGNRVIQACDESNVLFEFEEMKDAVNEYVRVVEYDKTNHLIKFGCVSRRPSDNPVWATTLTHKGFLTPKYKSSEESDTMRRTLPMEFTDSGTGIIETFLNIGLPHVSDKVFSVLTSQTREENPAYISQGVSEGVDEAFVGSRHFYSYTFDIVNSQPESLMYVRFAPPPHYLKEYEHKGGISNFVSTNCKGYDVNKVENHILHLKEMGHEVQRCRITVKLMFNTYEGSEGAFFFCNIPVYNHDPNNIGTCIDPILYTIPIFDDLGPIHQWSSHKGGVVLQFNLNYMLEDTIDSFSVDNVWGLKPDTAVNITYVLPTSSNSVVSDKVVGTFYTDRDASVVKIAFNPEQYQKKGKVVIIDYYYTKDGSDVIGYYTIDLSPIALQLQYVPANNIRWHSDPHESDTERRLFPYSLLGEQTLEHIVPRYISEKEDRLFLSFFFTSTTYDDLQVIIRQYFTPIEKVISCTVNGAFVEYSVFNNTSNNRMSSVHIDVSQSLFQSLGSVNSVTVECSYLMESVGKTDQNIGSYDISIVSIIKSRNNFLNHGSSELDEDTVLSLYDDHILIPSSDAYRPPITSNLFVVDIMHSSPFPPSRVPIVLDKLRHTLVRTLPKNTILNPAVDVSLWNQTVLQFHHDIIPIDRFDPVRSLINTTLQISLRVDSPTFYSLSTVPNTYSTLNQRVHKVAQELGFSEGGVAKVIPIDLMYECSKLCSVGCGLCSLDEVCSLNVECDSNVCTEGKCDHGDPNDTTDPPFKPYNGSYTISLFPILLVSFLFFLSF